LPQFWLRNPHKFSLITVFGEKPSWICSNQVNKNVHRKASGMLQCLKADFKCSNEVPSSIASNFSMLKTALYIIDFWGLCMTQFHLSNLLAFYFHCRNIFCQMWRYGQDICIWDRIWGWFWINGSCFTVHKLRQSVGSKQYWEFHFEPKRTTIFNPNRFSNHWNFGLWAI